MKKLLFTGACTALVTPFLGSQINYPMLEQLLRRQMEAGIEAIVIAGTTGESPTLSDDEKLELFRRAKEYIGDRCKIIAGTGSNSTEHTVMLSRKAQDTGVDGLLVVSPYYNKPTPEGLLTHYMTLAQAVDLPILVYNVPTRSGVDIPLRVYRQLSMIPNIAGVKEASPDIGKLCRIIGTCGSNLPVYTGNDEHICPAMALGAKGVISVLSNVFPIQTQALAKAALDGDFDTAADLQIQMQPLVEMLFSEPNPIPVKAAMAMMGYDCGDCRLPLTAMNPEKSQMLKTLLK